MSPRLRSLLQSNRSKSAASILTMIHAPLRAQMFAVAAAPTLLNFNMEAQPSGSNWCWAAVAKSVSHFYDQTSYWTQCLVAEQACPGSPCCRNRTPCDKFWYLDRALGYTSNFVAPVRARLAFATIQNELQNQGYRKVIGARTEWPNPLGAIGHFVVIYDCYQNAGVNYLCIADPANPNSNVDEAGFQNSYLGSGRWTHSYYTTR